MSYGFIYSNLLWVGIISPSLAEQRGARTLGPALMAATRALRINEVFMVAAREV